MNKLILKLLFILPILISCHSGKDKNPNPVNRPNLILFFTDDNDFSYWGFGGGPDLSPNIDRIAENGLTCTQFYCSSPVCTPSRYTLHTGKYSGRCREERFIRENPYTGSYNILWNTFMDASQEETLGELLQAEGYTTGYVGKWHLGFDITGYDFAPDDDPADPDVDAKLKKYQADIIEHIKATGYDYASSITPTNNDTHPVKAVRVHNLEWFAKGAVDFIEKNSNSDDPFFLIINITTHHGPCHTESIESDISITQAGFVEGLEDVMASRETIYERIEKKGYKVDFKTAGTVWTDDCVEAVMRKLEEFKLIDHTAVIFTTDHNRYDGKATCYQGGVHIPFIMQYPGIIRPGSVCDQRIQLVDLFPTFLKLAGGSVPSDLHIDGRDAINQLTGKADQALHEDLYFEFGYTRAVLSGNYKYIALRYPEELLENMKMGNLPKAYDFRGKLSDGPSVLRYPCYFDPDQLYNIADDPEEQNNLAYNLEYQDVLNDMKQKLSGYLAGFNHPFTLEEVDPFYFTEEYKELTEKARIINMEQYYWYRKGCY